MHVHTTLYYLSFKDILKFQAGVEAPLNDILCSNIE